MQVRFGIIGPGNIADRLMKDFHNAQDGQMVAVASRDLQRARDFAQKWSIPTAYGSYRELYDDPQVDVVYIATLNAFHKEQAMEAMRHGKHVLVEKPAALNAAQFAQMAACAQENDVFLMEGMWTRFFPATRRVHELLRSGEIGELRGMQATFSFYVREIPGMRLFAPEMGGGALLDVGCYPIHYAIDMFTGEPKEVMGMMVPAGTGVDAQCSLSLRFPQGLASLQCAVNASAQAEATLLGTEGSVYVPNFYHPRRVHLRRTGEVERVLSFPFEEEGFAYEIQHVCECVRRGMQQSDLMSWNDSLAALRVMDGLRTQWGIQFPGERNA